MKGVAEYQDRAVRRLFGEADNMVALLSLLEGDLSKLAVGARLELLDSSLIPESLKKLDEDLIYEGQSAEVEGFVLLFAHQSVADPLMPFRIFCALSRLYELDVGQQRASAVRRSQVRLRAVLPILVYSGDRPWTCPAFETLFKVPESLRQFLPSFKVLTLDLARCDPWELCQREGRLGPQLALFAAQYRDSEAFADVFERSLRALQGCSGPAEQLKEDFRFCVRFALERRNEDEWGTLDKLVTMIVGEEFGMTTMADRLRAEGHEEGLKEGREQTLREVARDLLAARYPEVAEEELAKRLESLQSPESVRALLVKFARVVSWDELWEN